MEINIQKLNDYSLISFNNYVSEYLSTLNLNIKEKLLCSSII
jgi:hypothetical protein